MNDCAGSLARRLVEAPAMPRGLAKMVTFVLCGFALHDVPAWVITRRILPLGATIAFILFGLGAVLSDAFHMNCRGGRLRAERR